GMPGIVNYCSQVREVQQRREIITHRIVDYFAAVGRRRERTDEGRDIMDGVLIKGGSGNSVRIPLENERTVVQIAQEHRGELTIVANEIAFGITVIWPVGFVEMGKGNGL